MAAGNVYRYKAVTLPVIYSALAPLYDRIMAHVEYHAWFSLIQKILSTYSIRDNLSILELGGGTGTLAKLLIENGFPLYGSDISFSMCREAQKKGLAFFCADAASLPVKSLFSLILFLYDGINYLTSLHDYTNLFMEVYPCLDAHGLFLFDITTETNSKTNFIDLIDAEDFGDASYVRHSYYDKTKSIQHNDFTLYRKYPGYSTFYMKECEYHTQKIFSVKEILGAVPRNHFTVLGVWNNFSFKRYTPRSERIHFLLQKVDAP